MTKQELAAYMASIATILEQSDKSGVHNRSGLLGDEYMRSYDQFKEIVRKEREDEARQSEQQRLSAKDGAEAEGGIPRRG